MYSQRRNFAKKRLNSSRDLSWRFDAEPTVPAPPPPPPPPPRASQAARSQPRAFSLSRERKEGRCPPRQKYGEVNCPDGRRFGFCYDPSVARSRFQREDL